MDYRDMLGTQVILSFDNGDTIEAEGLLTKIESEWSDLTGHIWDWATIDGERHVLGQLFPADTLRVDCLV